MAGAGAASQSPEPRTSFERALLAELKQGGDTARFEVPALALPRLALALERDLRSPDPEAGLTRALQLAAAFDGPLASPAVAAQIRELLRASPEVLQFLGQRLFGAGAIDRLRAFARSEARAAPVRAPVFGASAPRASVPLRTLLDPAAELGPTRHRR